MRCKARVLARFPDARLVAAAQWPDGSGTRYWRVIAGPEYSPDTQFLDVHDPDDRWTQGTTAAWRSAHTWCFREARKNSELLARHNRLLETKIGTSPWRNAWGSER
jgi:hypothetical protein